MATLEFTEYPALKMMYGAAVPAVGAEYTTQQVAIGTSSAASAAFNAASRIIAVYTDTACRIAIGPTPVASKTAGSLNRLLQAGGEYTFLVDPGQKLAVIAA